MVHYIIGKLRAIFTSHGRVDRKNHASLPEVKRYGVFVLEEQATAAFVPRQALPMVPSKLAHFVDYLVSCQHNPSTSPIQRYLLTRDITFFVIDFFTGDRASDLGRLQSHSVFQLPDQNGFLFHFSFGKTLRSTGAPTQPLVMKLVPSRLTFPMAWFRYYLDHCQMISVSVHPGNVFRATAARKFVSDRPFVRSAVSNRLRPHLVQMGVHCVETSHSFRGGVPPLLSRFSTRRNFARRAELFFVL